VRGYAGEGQLWLERALSSGELTEGARAKTLSAISLLLFAKGEIGRMSELVEEAIVEAREIGDEETLAFAIVQRGYAATFRGDLVQNALSQVAISRGDFGRAMELLRESEAALRETEDAFSLANNLNIQATISQLEGDDARTAALLRESVGLSAALRDTWALIYGLIGLAGVATRQGDPERATRLFGAAEALGEAASVTPSFPPTQALYERDVARVRTRLDAETFDAAWAEGRAMTPQEAVAEALTENG
jgi:hypothetical protein